MKIIEKTLICAALTASLSGLSAHSAWAKNAALSDAQIKQRIIEESIADYPRACACPYNRARNGSRCGGRSAWRRAGGYVPLCYPDDVSAARVGQWKAAQRRGQ
ncbi:hypothetical protein FJU30_24760 [Affinibrenneria salicis]|uniref:Uncharacterized protein n=1 Tax=Affinibrenneria salicis TaxID=2590031 RepID=A0A5J5FSA2_9GAMM|nr:hypothetical protein [Affinibrenneria salicis]KAA8995231.1 hypothetical protein FJU30_24760 [Affinibrenneria salicis]